MKAKNIVPLTEKYLNLLHTSERWIAETLSFLSPIATPLLSVYLIYTAIQQPPFDWPQWAAVLLGVVMEILGISVISTAVTIAYHAKIWSKKIVALIGPFVYVVASFLIVVTVKSGLLNHEGIILGITYSCFVAFALVSALNLAVRRDHYELVTKPPKRQKRSKSPANGKFILGDRNALNLANSTREGQKRARQAQVLTLLSDGMTKSQIANELNVSYSTIKRDQQELNGQVKQ